MNASSHLQSRWPFFSDGSFVAASVGRSLSLAMALLSSMAWSSVACAQTLSAIPSTADGSCNVSKHLRTSPVATEQQPDWTTLASTYTHDGTGNRVDQHSLPVPAYSGERPDLVKSGFRYSRSSIQVGFGVDHYHTTEQWGGPIQPYGQWRYPFRPYSVPYGAWGPQLPQVVVGGLGNGNGWNGGGNANGWHGPVGPGPNNPNVPPQGQPMNPPINPQAWQGNGGWNGQAPGWNGPGWNNPGNGYPPTNNGQGFGGSGAFGVGPANALGPLQDDYYPQAPIYQPLNGGFNSPYRN